jgi:hypothetical protein
MSVRRDEIRPSAARRQRLAAFVVWLAAMFPFFLLALHHRGWAPPTHSGDYAQYLSHARALVEGRPYGDIGYLWHPAASLLGPPTYPPGLPLTIAPIVAIDGVHSVLLRLLMLASIAGFAYLAFRRLAREMEPWQAAVGAGFTAFVVEASLAALVPISDPGFMVLLWAMILAVDAAQPWTWRRIALVTALGFATMAYRLPGIVIVPALGLFAIATWRAHGGRALVPAAIWAAAVLAVLIVDPSRLSYGSGVGARIADVSELRMMFDAYRFAVFEAELYPFATDRWNDVHHLVATGVVLIGLVPLISRMRRSFLVILALAYVALLAVAPFSEPRYLWPLLPLVAASLASGLQRTVAYLGRAWPMLPPRTVAAALIAVIAVGAFRQELATKAPTSLAGADELALYTWLRSANERAPMRVAFENPRVVTLETRVPAMGFAARSAPGQLEALLDRNITHVIRRSTDESSCVQRIANEMIQSDPALFTLEYENPSYRVFRLRPGTRAPHRPFEAVDWSWADRC